MRLICEATEIPRSIPIHLFGAGALGSALLGGLARLHDVRVAGIIDNFRTGRLGSVPILTWAAFLAQAGPEDLVLMAVREYATIRKELSGFPEDRIWNAYPLALATIRRDQDAAEHRKALWAAGPVGKAEKTAASATEKLAQGHPDSAQEGYRSAVRTLAAAAWEDESILLSDLFADTVRRYQNTDRIRIPWEGALRGDDGEAGKTVVAQAKDHYRDAVARQRTLGASPFWAPRFGHIENAIPGLTSTRDVLHFATDQFTVHAPALEVLDSLPARVDLLKSEFPHFEHLVDTLGDCSPFCPDRAAPLGGRLVSTAVFCHLRPFLRCLTHLRPETICEIGGGYGGLAQLWLDNPVHRPGRYILVDFPSSLFFAEVYLRTLLPAVPLRYVQDDGPLPAPEAGGKEILLCPIGRVEALASLPLDLVINIYSMQEMTDSALGFWHGWLARQPCRFFYSLNMFALPVEQAEGLLPGCAPWTPALPRDWQVKFQQVDRSGHRTYKIAEVLAEKTGPPSGADLEGMLALYEVCRNRILDDRLLLELLDVVRRLPDEGLVWDLLRRCVARPDGIPQEARWLARTLADGASRTLMAAIEPEFLHALEQIAAAETRSQ